jgi:hypothetical protein
MNTTHPTHAEICENVIDKIATNYQFLLPSDTDVIIGLQVKLMLGQTEGLPGTEYLRLATAALKRAGNRTLANEVRDLYLTIVREDD